MKPLDARTAYLLRAGVGQFCAGLIFISLAAYYIRTIGMDPLQLVLVGTALELTVFLFEVPTGIVADVYSRRLSVLIGGFLVGACYILTGLIPVFAIIIVAEIIRGIGSTFISGAESAWITDEVGVDRIRNLFLRRGQIGQIANLLGIWCSVILASLFSYQVPILLGGTGLIGLNLYMVFVMPETNFKPTPRQERDTFQHMFYALREGISVIRASAILLLLIGAEIIVGAASEGFDRLAEAHYLQNLNMPTLEIPVIGTLDPIAWFAIWNVAAVAVGLTVLEYARRRLKTDHPQQAARSLMVLETITMVSAITFGFTLNFPLAFISELVRHTSRQLIYPIRDAWLNQNIPSNVRATVLSLHAQANAFGQIAGGPGVGLVGNRFGIRTALVLAGFLLMPAVALYGLTFRRHQVRRDSQQA